MGKNHAFPPERRNKIITLAIPASLVKDTPHLREKVFKIGLIGRAISVFRIEEIIIYSDTDYANQANDAYLIRLILEYMETPQYLRKYIFKLLPQLKYVGILPPLKTPHHLVSSKIENLFPNDIREGFIVKSYEKISLANIGLNKLAKVNSKLKKGSRIALKIKSVNDEIWADPIRRKEIKIYWGYRVIFPKLTLGKIIKRADYDLIIATSKYGKKTKDVLDSIRIKWEESRKVLIIFGSPSHGVDEILAQEDIKTENVTDYKINMIPNQGVETVRTEEAAYASLSILNLLD